jgi:hypothetical protein
MTDDLAAEGTGLQLAETSGVSPSVFTKPKKKGYTSWTPERLQLLKDMWSRGDSSPAIAEALGVTIKQVEDVLEDNPEIPWHRAVHSIIDPTILNSKSGGTAIVTPNKSKQDGVSDLKPASAADPVANEYLDAVRAVLGDIDPEDDAPPF